MSKKQWKFKQVIVVRRDLKMSPGKLAGQVAHASVGAIFCMLSQSPEMSLVENRYLLDWFTEGYAKIVLAVPNEKILRDIQVRAQEMGLPTHLVKDFGLTEIAPDTVTCLGIGPAPVEAFETLTKKLSLYK